MSLYSPRQARYIVSEYSSCVRELFMQAALTPAEVSALTWSFISDISGDTTTVMPLSMSAGT